MRCWRSVALLSALALLSGCAAERPHYYQLGGTPLVGHVTKAVPAQIWIGDIANDGFVYWFETEGPAAETISFSDFGGCLGSAASPDRYVVFVVRLKPPRGIVADLPPTDVPALSLSSCTKVDPNSSFFTTWVDR